VVAAGVRPGRRRRRSPIGKELIADLSPVCERALGAATKIENGDPCARRATFRELAAPIQHPHAVRVHSA
jgi:hypothetical protein